MAGRTAFDRREYAAIPVRTWANPVSRRRRRRATHKTPQRTKHRSSASILNDLRPWPRVLAWLAGAARGAGWPRNGVTAERRLDPTNGGLHISGGAKLSVTGPRDEPHAP